MCVLWTKSPEESERRACRTFCISQNMSYNNIAIGYMIKRYADCQPLACHMPVSCLYGKKGHIENPGAVHPLSEGHSVQTNVLDYWNRKSQFIHACLVCRVPVTVTTIYRDDNEVQAAKGGENLRLRLGGVDEDEVSPGFVLCSRHLPVPAVTYFDAQLHLLDLLEHKSLFSAGYKAILHIHAAVEECEITALLAQIDPKTKQKKKVRAV